MRTTIHLLMLVLAFWLPIGQAGACCAAGEPPVAATGAQDAHDPTASMPCHEVVDAGEAAVSADTCDAGCAQLCHMAGAIAVDVFAPADVAGSDEFAPVTAVTHLAYTRRLLRPPADSAML